MSLSNKSIQTDDLLIKQFFIIGLDSDKILDSNFFLNIKNISDSHKLTPSVLSLFPSLPKSSTYIDENLLLRHCFPNGFYLKKFSQFPLPEHFSFELNNFPLYQKNPNLYFTCLSFYEPIENYNLFKIINDKGIKYAEKYLKTPKNRSDSMKGISALIDEGYYIEKVIGFITVDYQPQVMTKILYLLHGRYMGHFNEINEPLEKIIESLIFQIPYIKVGKYKLEVIFFNKQLYFEYPPVNSIPLQSVEIYKIFERYNVAETLQIFLALLLEEPILLFSENKSELTSTFDAFLSLLYPFKCIEPHCAILPNNSFGLIESCRNFIFGVNQSYNNDFFQKNEISIFNKKILVLDLDKRNKFIIKPNNVIQIDLDNDIYNDVDFFNNKDINEKDNDIDYNYRNFNFDLNENPKKKEEEIDLPIHYKKKTHNIILNYIKDLGKNLNQNNNSLEIDNFNHKTKEQFSYFLVSILLDYSNYLNLKTNFTILDNFLLNPENDINIEKLFNIEEFINSHKVDELFYRKFFHTKLFKDFIIRKIYPITLEDKIDILYFDERIADKKNKNAFGNKINTPFIYYQFSCTSNKIIINPENFSLNEINYIKNDYYNNKKYLKYYQVIINEQNSNNIKIKYPIFPKLLYDDYYFGRKYYEINRINNIPELNMNALNIKIKKIYNLIKSPEFNAVYKNVDYSLNYYDDSSLLRIPQKFILPNVWIALNALTLNYCHTTEEKNSRFAEIIEKIYDSEFIDIDIISLVLIVVSKYSTPENLLITFAKILKNKILLNNYTLHSIVISNLSKSFNSDMISSKTNIVSSRAAILNKKDSNMEIIDLSNLKFDKRGIYSKDENIKESIEFGVKTMCPYCRLLNLIDYNILLEQEGKVQGILLSCGSCKKSFAPRIKVNINDKIIENFGLISCWDMLEYIKNELMTNNKFSIDVINFKKNNEEFFWNAVFYFSVNGLNFDFLTPYVKDIPKNIISKKHFKNNIDNNIQFSELYYERTNKVTYNEKKYVK